MSDWLHNVPSHEKIKECFAETAALMPENVDGLKSVKINEMLYQKLLFEAKINDQRIGGINSYFSQGTGPLIAILDKLIDFEASMKVYITTSVSCEEGKLKLKNSSLNISEIRHYLHTAMKILSFGHATCLQKRKSLLKAFLDQRYHYLVRPSNPVTEELLGPNLEQKIADSNRVMEATHKLYFGNKFHRQYSYKKGRAGNNSARRGGFAGNTHRHGYMNNMGTDYQNKRRLLAAENRQHHYYTNTTRGNQRARGKFQNRCHITRGRYNARK